MSNSSGLVDLPFDPEVILPFFFFKCSSRLILLQSSLWPRSWLGPGGRGGAILSSPLHWCRPHSAGGLATGIQTYVMESPRGTPFGRVNLDEDGGGYLTSFKAHLGRAAVT